MKLELLTPWELPIKSNLTQNNQIQIQKVLKELLTALTQPNIQQNITIIENLIMELEIYDVFTPEITSTNTVLKYWEIEEFDTYFQVNHIQTTEPEICLVKSLLATIKTFLCLNQSNVNLDVTQINLQREGFLTYIYLLGRVFQLELEL
ncbi:hypothetical protein [Nodularia sphaerocarpa]|uniref:hypothetical protein n=1 Tax=Nodularia sphaerocarpa TaxID=137816 RepID=UPI001EFC2BD7|nr:hypothetical protein [Nodularia sphaerocarpa]MDB9372681.1 hypothetical protein [Nodularia sphaerocarpa CS-585]MDB9378741.1 hypothetical protein [Nodularia sphaerocarpa CS-585A2]ULP71187.1 hypothetical protein BDGGKGIB_00810 [Nodularia sphaerocarpa UHCC 0038]